LLRFGIADFKLVMDVIDRQIMVKAFLAMLFSHPEESGI
jgi:hypothetical protein